MRGALRTTLLVVAFTLCAGAARAEPVPYSEGTVWELTFIKVKPGMTVDYLRSLSSTWKRAMDEARKQGTIVSYKVLSGDAANRDDFDMLLMIELKNMAALDGLSDKMRALFEKNVGPEEQRRSLMTKRLDVREIAGVKIVRELILK